MLGLLTISLAPREIALALAILGIATAIADGVIVAVVGADPRRDELPGGGLARWSVGVVFTTAVAGVAVLGGPALARSLGHYELASLSIWIVPLALARVLDRQARESWLPSVKAAGVVDLASWLLAAAVLMFFTSRGKTVTAVTAAAGAFAGARALLSLRVSTLRPSRRALLPVLSIAPRALKRLPLALAATILTRLDVFLTLGILGAEAAGLWLVARTLMLDRDLAMWSLSPGIDHGEPAEGGAPSVAMVFLGIFALLAPVTVRDLIGPRYVPLAEWTAWLLPVTTLLWLKASVLRSPSRLDGSAFVAAVGVAIAPAMFPMLPAVAMALAIAVGIGASWRGLRPIDRDFLSAPLCATGLGLVAALGAADLAAAFGASGRGIFAAATIAGVGPWLAWTFAAQWSARRIRAASPAPVAVVAKESGK